MNQLKDEFFAQTSNFYSLEVQHPDRLYITIVGFWTPETMADFLRDVTRAVLDLSCPPGSHTVVCNVTGSALQSQANCNEFIRLLTDERLPARGVAFVTRNPASRMQVRRLMTGQKNAALFDNEERAIDWLTSRATNDV